MEKAHRKKSIIGSNMVTDTTGKKQRSGMAYNRTDFNKVITFLLLIALMIALFTPLLSGCGSPSLVYYENQEWNFSLEYPDNWKLNEDDRVANDFSLQATKGLFKKSGARIVITSGFPTPEMSPAELETTMENYLVSVAEMTHIFKSLEVLQISDIIDNGTHKMIWATVSVPTIDIAEDGCIPDFTLKFKPTCIYQLSHSQWGYQSQK